MIGKGAHCIVELNIKTYLVRFIAHLKKQANPYIDNKNKKRMIWQIQGLEDFAAMYEQLKKVLKIVTT